MSAVQELRPDVGMMLDHLKALFVDQTEGRIEIAWTDTTPPYALRHAETFPVGDLVDAATRAAELNATPYCNVYVGAAVRKDDVPPFGRCSDDDALCLPAVYADLDEPGVQERAAQKAHETGNFPTFVVYTGAQPYVRAQLYWRVFTPIPAAKRETYRGILRAACRATDGDPSVVNPGRVLRLGGSVAWAVKEGRTHEMTRFVRPPQGKTWNLPALATALGYDANIDGDGANLAPTARQSEVTVAPAAGANAFGLPEDKIDDGREGYMTRMVNAAFVTYVGENGAVPTVDELVRDVWPVYSKEVNLHRPGRGLSELQAKCRYIIERFEAGEHTKYLTLDDVVTAYQERGTTRPFVDDVPDFGTSDAPAAQSLDGVDFDDAAEAAPPRWLAKGLLHADGVAFVGGQSGAGKTFAHVHIAVGLASGTDVFGHKVKERVGTVILAAEGAGTIKTRVRVARLARGIAEPLPVAVIRDVPDLMVAANHAPLAEKLRAVDRTFKDAYDVRLGVVVIDTVSAAFGMQDEDDNAEAAKAIRVMAAMSASLGVLVMPVHHYGKTADTGLRGASAWRAGADTVLSVIAERDQLTGDVQRRALALAKSRVTDEGPISDFKLTFMKLGEDEDGDDVGACHIELVAAAAAGQRGELNTGEKTLVKAFEATFDQAVTVGLPDGPRVRAVRLDVVRAEFGKWYPTGETDRNARADAVRKAFKRAVTRSAKCRLVVGLIGADEYVWKAGIDE